MKKQKFTKVKSRSLYAIKIYLDNKQVSERVEVLAEKMGLSLSSVGGLLFRYGLPVLEKAIEKIDVQEVDFKKSK